jgi:adenylate cyclase
VSERAQRQLAAILAADVAGYGRLIGKDEEGTLARLKELRRTLFDPKIGEHRGRIVKTMGDGLLVQFGSVVDAVRCAVDIQGIMAEQQEGTAGDLIAFRMGINVGDIILDGEDIHGDGVNVAARLEGLSEPGGIYVSGGAYDQVRDKLDLSFEDTGEHQLKNIARPVRIYRLRLDQAPGPSRPPSLHPSKPSIAVLPFVNMSGDPEQQYLSDGMTEDVITELARFRPLNVIARNASFRFRGDNVDVLRAGRELGAQYLLEGSVRRIAGNIRITAQLIDATTGSHLWAEKFDRPQIEIFAVQDEVVRIIVGTLAGRLDAVGVENALRKPPNSLAAYECVLRAEALPITSLEAQAEARRLAERAIELDPSYGRAYSQLAMSYELEWARDYSGSNAKLDEALRLAKRAITLNENDSSAFVVLGRINMLQRSYDQAQLYFEKAAAINPNRPSPIVFLGELYGYLGRPDEGIACFDQARRIDRFFEPSWFWSAYGILHFIAGRYQEAILQLSRSQYTTDYSHGFLGACYALTGQQDKATHHIKEALSLSPQLSVQQFLAKEPLRGAADREHLMQGLRKAGLPE